MSIWDKLAASTELAIGGRIGALLDGMKGDRVVDPDRDRPENQVAFTVGVIALGAKMARADGGVTRDEIFAFKEAFKVSDAEMKHAARVFNLAKRDVAGYETYAEELVIVFKGNRKLLEDVLDGLFHIAKADEALHPEEEQFLGQVAKRFGFTDTEFGHVKARHVIAANHPNKLIARGVPEEFVTIATEKIVTFNEAYGAIAKQRGI